MPSNIRVKCPSQPRFPDTSFRCRWLQGRSISYTATASSVRRRKSRSASASSSPSAQAFSAGADSCSSASPDMAWLELSGELIMKNLAPGETLLVHPGHVGAFQASVNFQITTVPGIKNLIFGGDGIFLGVLSGPGTVWLQTLPISRLAHQIGEYLPRAEGREVGPAAAGGAILGGVLGSMFGNIDQ